MAYSKRFYEWNPAWGSWLRSLLSVAILALLAPRLAIGGTESETDYRLELLKRIDTGSQERKRSNHMLVGIIQHVGQAQTVDV